jgi:uncharacterized membrane protein
VARPGGAAHLRSLAHDAHRRRRSNFPQGGLDHAEQGKVSGAPCAPDAGRIPVGLFATSLVFDLIRMAGGAEGFSIAAFYMVAAGIVGALAAAVFGIVDYLAIPRGTRAKRMGLMHGGVNAVMVALFIISWAGRYADPAAFLRAPLALSAIGVALALASGWLGGELVNRLGVGVDDGAHLDAPSSLSGRPASEKWTPPRPLRPRRA